MSWYGMAWHGELVSNSQAHCTICIAQTEREERKSTEQSRVKQKKKKKEQATRF